MKIKIIQNPNSYNEGGKLNTQILPKRHMFAEGGNVLGGYHTNGADWLQPGNFHIIGNGGTHEENKNEGVQQGADPQGVPNLVEENEVVYNDYVFSNRLIIPKRRKGKEKEISDLTWEEKMLKPYEGKTYADAAQKAYSAIQERPHGSIERRQFETILGILANSQEKERAKQEHQEAADQITEMSGQEFAEQKAMEKQQAQQEQMMQQQAMQQQMQEQQQTQMSPEEQAMMQQQQMAPQMACGGRLHAEGGDLNTGTTSQEISQESMQDSTNAKEEGPAFMNIEDAEELSTSQLNTTIEEIIQYAKENKLRDIVKAGRKAKKGSRDDKEDFVEDSKDTIDTFMQEQRQKELQEQEQIMQEQQMQQQMQQQAASEQAQQPSSEQAAQAELDAQMQQDAQMQGQQFAGGGQMDQQQQLAQMQQLATMYSNYLQQTNPKLYEQTNAELQQYLQQAQQSGQVSQEELQMVPIQYYASRAQQDSEFLKQLKQSQRQQYALGGNMSKNLFATGGSKVKVPEDPDPTTPIDITQNTDGNKKQNQETTRIREAIKHHDNFFRKSIQDYVKKKTDAIKIALDAGNIAEARALRDSFMKEWNDINTAYSKMNVKDEASIEALQTAFNNAGLNGENSSIVNDVLTKAENEGGVKIVSQKKNEPYIKDNPIDKTLGVVTSNRYLDVDNDTKALLNKYGINYKNFGDNDNQNFYHLLNVSNDLLNTIENPKWTELTPEQRVAESQNPKGIKKTIPLIDYIRQLQKEDPDKYKGINIDKLTPEDFITLGFEKNGEVSPVDINTDTQLWKIKPEDEIEKDPDDGTNPENKKHFYKTPNPWPFYTGIGLQGAAALYNALTPVDYSNADALINASKEAGQYQPVEFRPIGDYLAYRPLDRNYEGNKVRSAMAAERSALANLSGGNRGTAAANMLASDYNLINQLGNIDRKAAESNRDHEAKVADFNRATNQFNSEGFLKADMANQETLMKAGQSKLEGLAKGYAMRQAAEEDKSKSISASISGLAQNLFNAYQQNYINNQIDYSLESRLYGSADTRKSYNNTQNNDKNKGKANGGNIVRTRRRRRGLTF